MDRAQTFNSFASLHFDVLDLIFSFLTPLNALRISPTCRAMYEMAIPHALVRVELSYEHAARFHTFLVSSRARELQSWKFLRHVSIRRKQVSWASYRSADLFAAQALAGILRVARNLESLRIGGFEALCRTHSEVGHALTALTGLEELVLEQVSASTLVTLLPALKSCHSIRRLELALVRKSSIELGTLMAACVSYTQLTSLGIQAHLSLDGGASLPRQFARHLKLTPEGAMLTHTSPSLCINASSDTSTAETKTSDITLEDCRRDLWIGTGLHHVLSITPV